MSKRIKASWWVAVAALLLLTPLAFSQNTVYLTLDDGGNNGAMGGIYVGPYDATMSSGPNQPGTNTPVICDDFEHEVTQGQQWYANVTSFTSITDSTKGLVWSGATSGLGLGGSTGDMVQGYTAMAYLATQLLGASGANAGYLAYAIWAVFDANGVYNWLVTKGNDPGIWNTVQTMAESALGKAISGAISQGQYAGWEILTPTIGGSGAPQEFFVFVPEGGTALMYLLLAGFACFGTMYFKSRRRASQTV